MEEEEDMSPPFWLQNNGGGGDRRRLSRSYSMFISSGVFLILFLVTALAFIFVVVPTLHSFSSNIFNKPHNSVKKSWDSLNLVLVLFAIFCGFLSRNNNTNESPRSYEDQTIQTFSDTNTPQEYQKPNPEETPPPVPRPWYEYSDHRITYNRLRSFRSYPDLRQESLWVAGDERWRFYDDTRVNGYRGLDLDAEEEKEEETGTIKHIEVDTFVARGGRNTERTYQPETIEKQRNNAPKEESLNYYRTGKKNRRASATKELLTSLKGKKKKKKKKQSVENSQSIPPPPPPLPPPPSSVFHNLFSSKKSKHKKLHSASSSSSSPPPPQKHHVSPMLVSKTKPVHVGVATHKPRVSNKGEDFFAFEENVVMTGNESPLIPIPPPPPPPPPFKMPAWKFRVQGDYVRIDSMSSTSDSGSPELDEVVESPRSTTGEPSILLVYPTPNADVDSKADNFIESFRAGLKMEKMKSIKEKKQGIRRSNLYSSPKDETGQPS